MTKQEYDALAKGSIIDDTWNSSYLVVEKSDICVWFVSCYYNEDDNLVIVEDTLQIDSFGGLEGSDWVNCEHIVNECYTSDYENDTYIKHSLDDVSIVDDGLAYSLKFAK